MVVTLKGIESVSLKISQTFVTSSLYSYDKKLSVSYNYKLLFSAVNYIKIIDKILIILNTDKN